MLQTKKSETTYRKYTRWAQTESTKHKHIEDWRHKNNPTRYARTKAHWLTLWKKAKRRLDRATTTQFQYATFRQSDQTQIANVLKSRTQTCDTKLNTRTQTLRQFATTSVTEHNRVEIVDGRDARKSARFIEDEYRTGNWNARYANRRRHTSVTEQKQVEQKTRDSNWTTNATSSIICDSNSYRTQAVRLVTRPSAQIPRGETRNMHWDGPAERNTPTSWSTQKRKRDNRSYAATTRSSKQKRSYGAKTLQILSYQTTARKSDDQAHATVKQSQLRQKQPPQTKNDTNTHTGWNRVQRSIGTFPTRLDSSPRN